MTAATDFSGRVGGALSVLRPGSRSHRKRKMTMSFRISLSIALLIVLIAIFGPLFTSNPLQGDPAHRLLGMGSPGHLLGTDGQGRDVLSRIINGTRPSLLTGLIPVGVATLVGATLGIAAGRPGGGCTA